MKFNQNDNELLYLAAQKDEDAKNALYKKYSPVLNSLSRTAYHYSKAINGTTYEDFYQEACFGFEKAIASYDEARNILFYTYAISCVKYQLALYQRKLNCKKDIPLNFALSLNKEVKAGISYEDLITGGNPSPYEVCENMELEEDLKTFQNRLPFLEACVFELRYNGFAYKEIASLLDISTRRVSAILQKVKKYYSFLKSCQI